MLIDRIPGYVYDLMLKLQMLNVNILQRKLILHKIEQHVEQNILLTAVRMIKNFMFVRISDLLVPAVTSVDIDHRIQQLHLLQFLKLIHEILFVVNGD